MLNFSSFSSPFGRDGSQNFSSSLKEALKGFGIGSESFERLKANATAGDVKAALKLGLFLASDKRSKPEDAFKWIEKAAASGEPEALHYYSAFLSVGFGCEKNSRKALEYCARAAKLGALGAVIDMGLAYLEGEGVTRDPVKAARCFQLAVDRGSGKACSELALCYFDGVGVERNPEKAKEILQLGIERGSGICAYNLGVSYYKGRFDGVPDFPQARDCFEKSCALGEPAFYELAMMYLCGEGIPVDQHKGLNVLMRGAEADDPASLVELGKLYLRGDKDWRKIHDPQKGYRCLQRACELGYGPAFSICAGFYEEGYGLEASDPARAVKILELGARCGDKESAFRLGLCYAHGNCGLQPDGQRALAYYERAFELGSSDAAAILGCSYKHGEDAPQDTEKGLYYLRSGAERGNGACLYELACSYADGDGVEEDMEKYKELLFKAADEDFAMAVGEIGMSYLEGVGGFPQDYAKAVEYLEDAVELGMDECLEPLANCYQKGLGVEKDKARAKELLRRAKEAE